MVAEDPFVYVQDVGSTVSAGAMVRLDEIFAALRAVEAVRAFPERDSSKIAEACGCSDCEGFLDGVKAVQALLESEHCYAKG
jgi:hypothetical protein